MSSKVKFSASRRSDSLTMLEGASECIFRIGRFCITFRAESLHITPPSRCDFRENWFGEIRTSLKGAHVASSIAKPYGYSHVKNADVRSYTNSSLGDNDEKPCRHSTVHRPNVLHLQVVRPSASTRHLYEPPALTPCSQSVLVLTCCIRCSQRSCGWFL